MYERMCMCVWLPEREETLNVVSVVDSRFFYSIFYHFPPSNRLHLLVLGLGVQTILALNINKSLVLADDDDASGTNSDFNVTNQSAHSLLNAFDANSNVNNRNNSRNDATQSSGRAAGSSKLYNKVNSRKRKLELDPDLTDWKCPNISENSRFLECGCDMPHALRCSGDIHGLEQLARGLRTTKYAVSLLDCTLKNVTFLSDTRIFENVSLHGLVISSGEIKRVHRLAFLGMKTPLQTLGKVHFDAEQMIRFEINNSSNNRRIT